MASSVVRDGEAERLGGLEVDDQLELGRLLHRQVGRLLALENAIRHKPPQAAKESESIWSVAHAGRRPLAQSRVRVDRRQRDAGPPAATDLIALDW